MHVYYARRWQVEMTIRYAKSELAFESPRLVKWQNRIKLLLIAALAYAFLLSLLDLQFDTLRSWLLCFAISLFWFSLPPPILSYL